MALVSNVNIISCVRMGQLQILSVPQTAVVGHGFFSPGDVDIPFAPMITCVVEHVLPHMARPDTVETPKVSCTLPRHTFWARVFTEDVHGGLKGSLISRWQGILLHCLLMGHCSGCGPPHRPYTDIISVGGPDM